MISRNMKHKSPLPEINFFKDFKYGEIDIEANIKELSSRCPRCKERFINQ